MRRQPPPPLASPLVPSPFSPALAVTGFLMVGVLFLLANPEFGVRSRSWPWDMFVRTHGSTLVRTLAVVWIFTGAWCLVLAFTASVALRAVGAALLGLPLLIEATSGVAGLSIADFNLNKMVPMILLGGGLLLAVEPPTRRAGRRMAGAGALLLVWALASGFTNNGTSAQIGLFLDDMGQVLRDPGHEFPDQPNHLWWNLVPQLLVFLAAFGGVFALLGVGNRVTAHVTFWVLFAGLCAPGIAGSVLKVSAGGGISTVLTEVTAALIGHGILLWMLGVFVIADLGKLSPAHAAAHAEELA